MYLEETHIVNFRKHHDLTYVPSQGVNLVYGPNGSGKTNILEAIHYCSLAKGMNRSLDKECLKFDADYFLLKSRFTDKSGRETAVKVTYEKSREKKIVVNNEELKKFSGIIGKIPCVTFTPYDLGIVNGSPQERRRFIDTALSQSYRTYLDNILQYRRVLQQRNALLAHYAEDRQITTSFDIWTEKLAHLGASIIQERLSFIDRLENVVKPLYTELGLEEIPGFRYHPSSGRITGGMSKEDIEASILNRFDDIAAQEIVRQQTLIGPHRDDMIFTVNGIDARKYASQGQIRTFLIALKLALQRMIGEIIEESPVFLLDDLFSELDENRIDRILHILEGSGQSIITTTEKRAFGAAECINIEEIV